MTIFGIICKNCSFFFRCCSVLFVLCLNLAGAGEIPELLCVQFTQFYSKTPKNEFMRKTLSGQLLTKNFLSAPCGFDQLGWSVKKELLKAEIQKFSAVKRCLFTSVIVELPAESEFRYLAVMLYRHTEDRDEIKPPNKEAIVMDIHEQYDSQDNYNRYDLNLMMSLMCQHSCFYETYATVINVQKFPGDEIHSESELREHNCQKEECAGSPLMFFRKSFAQALATFESDQIEEDCHLLSSTRFNLLHVLVGVQGASEEQNDVTYPLVEVMDILSSYPDILFSLMDEEDWQSIKPLGLAAARSSAYVISCLLKERQITQERMVHYLSERDSDDYCALDYAVLAENKVGFDYLFELMSRYGVRQQAVDHIFTGDDNSTLLHYAACRRCVHIVECLVEANPLLMNMVNDREMTPISMAAAYSEEYAIVHYLYVKSSSEKRVYLRTNTGMILAESDDPVRSRAFLDRLSGALNLKPISRQENKISHFFHRIGDGLSALKKRRKYRVQINETEMLSF
ncbi:hypothetical protein CI610_00493 [invertebrate metagenome]|uniref:Uncharacterized protein n=1 Tax=invertebrate metagenome TaxID=1711999 RepID=A0A2H9TBA3_9ZZZZ